MTGVLNKTARQLDLRGRDASGIVHVTLNPGFNFIDDDTLAVVLLNKHNAVLADEGAIVIGVRKTAVDEDLERAAAAAEAEANTLKKPTTPAAVVNVTPSKDPNAELTTADINPATGKKFTTKELKALATATPAADSLDLED